MTAGGSGMTAGGNRASEVVAVSLPYAFNELLNIYRRYRRAIAELMGQANMRQIGT